ncbi:MAG: hypothetical protein JW723_01865 [Bacteroidales bacterium]|nr:hypothetical protein [Bacteroidales bacterium]
MKNHTISLTVIVILLIACEEITTVNPVPVIEFKEFTLTEGKDTLGNVVFEGKLLFGFSDDDGADLSNTPYGDTIYSIITIPYIKNPDHSYAESDFDTVNNYLIYDEDMNISKVGQNKTLHGDIEITRYYFLIPADTIRYEFYIIDKDNNRSNVEVTSDIGFR